MQATLHPGGRCEAQAHGWDCGPRPSQPSLRQQFVQPVPGVREFLALRFSRGPDSWPVTRNPAMTCRVAVAIAKLAPW